MCNYNMHCLGRHSHFGASTPAIRACPAGGEHEPFILPVTGYLAMECRKCGLQGECTE